MRPEGYHVIISYFEEDPDSEKTEAGSLVARQVDGLIMASAQSTEHLLAPVRSLFGCACRAANHHRPGDRGDWKAAAELLIEQIGSNRRDCRDGHILMLESVVGAGIPPEAMSHNNSFGVC